VVFVVFKRFVSPWLRVELKSSHAKSHKKSSAKRRRAS
jgi:hypothetical protein